MLHVLEHTLIDTIKLLPFLWAVFTKKVLKKLEKYFDIVYNK